MKRKLLFLMTLVISAFAWNAKAQTDVTSTYLQNGGFDTSSDFQSGNIATGGSNQRKAVTGWSNYGGDTYTTGGCIGFGTDGQINGAAIPSTNSDGTADGGALTLNAAWQSSVYYSQEVTLPAGNYQFKFMVNNVGKNAEFEKDPTLFAFTTDKYTFCGNVHSYPVNTWTEQKIEFGLPEQATGTLKIGYKATNKGSGNTPKLVVDYVKAFYVSNYTSTLQAAINSAQALYARSNNADLNTAITHAQGVLAAADNTIAYQSTIDSEVTALESAMATALSTVVLLEGENISFMVENFDFESGTPVTVGITTYDYDCGNNGTYYSQQQTVEGWTIDANGNARSGGVFEFGGSPWLGSNGDSYKAPASGSESGQNKALGLVAVWSSTVQYKQPITLPAGAYVIEIPVYNTAGKTAFKKNLIGFVENGGIEHLATVKTYAEGSWITERITFNLNSETSGYLSLGYVAENSGSGGMPHLFVDYVKITYTSFLAAAKYAYDEALQAAKDATNDGANDNVTGAEYVAISSEIAKAEPTTVEGYEAATQALIEATSAFIAAAPSYDALINEISKANALGVDISDAQDVADSETTNAADALEATKDLKVAEYNYVTTDFPFAVELGTWNAEGPTGTMTGQHWAGGDGEYLEQSSAAWGQNAWTIKYSQDLTLPAGNYIFKVAGRKAAGDGVTMSLIVRNGETVLGSVSDFPEGDTGLGINTDGETDYDPSHTYANNNAGRGWEWRYVKFTLSEQTTVNVAVEAKATIAYQWVSFCDATVQTDDEAGFALIAYNVALADAQTILADENYANVTGYERYLLESLVEYDKDLDKTNKGDIETATTNLLGAITDFVEAKPAFDNLATAINDAQAINTTANVGGGVFQIPESAVQALNDAISAAQVEGSTTADDAVYKTQDLTEAIAAYQNAELNAPAADDHFKIVLVADNGDYTWNENAITFIANGRGDAGLYNIQYKPQNDAYAQAFTFTKSSGNDYTLSMVDEDGNTRYITTGIPYSGNKYQIRTSTNADDAALFTVKPTNTGGIFNLYNVEAERNVGSQDEGVYTVEKNNGFRFDVVNKASVDLAISADVKYATRVFPFVPTLPEGMVAYTCSEEEGDALVLVEATELKPNVPYILFADEGIASTVLEGWGLGKGEEAVTFGHLTGNYSDENMIVPMNSYVLQNKEGRVAFYRVTEDVFEEVYVSKYRCYLTAAEGAAKVINLNVGEATAIDAIEALTSGTAEIYNASGIRVNSLEKGLNIIRTSDGKIKKVLVK